MPRIPHWTEYRKFSLGEGVGVDIQTVEGEGVTDRRRRGGGVTQTDGSWLKERGGGSQIEWRGQEGHIEVGHT